MYLNWHELSSIFHPHNVPSDEIDTKLSEISVILISVIGEECPHMSETLCNLLSLSPRSIIAPSCVPAAINRRNLNFSVLNNPTESNQRKQVNRNFDGGYTIDGWTANMRGISDSMGASIEIQNNKWFWHVFYMSWAILYY